jgi:hypothetical protein
MAIARRAVSSDLDTILESASCPWSLVALRRCFQSIKEKKNSIGAVDVRQESSPRRLHCL